MVIYGDSLYVVDVNVLLIIDFNLVVVVEWVEVFIKYGINDVLVGEDGIVFVIVFVIYVVLKLVGDCLEIWV